MMPIARIKTAKSTAERMAVQTDHSILDTPELARADA
jgi:hypothetical protein